MTSKMVRKTNLFKTSTSSLSRNAAKYATQVTDTSNKTTTNNSDTSSAVESLSTCSSTTMVTATNCCVDASSTQNTQQALMMALQEAQTELRSKTEENKLLKQTVLSLSQSLQRTEQSRVDAIYKCERLDLRLQALTYVDYYPSTEKMEGVKKKKKSEKKSKKEEKAKQKELKLFRRKKRDKSVDKEHRVNVANGNPIDLDEVDYSAEEADLYHTDLNKASNVDSVVSEKLYDTDSDTLASDSEFEGDDDGYDNDDDMSDSSFDEEKKSDEEYERNVKVWYVSSSTRSKPKAEVPTSKSDGRLPVDLDLIDDLIAAEQSQNIDGMVSGHSKSISSHAATIQEEQQSNYSNSDVSTLLHSLLVGTSSSNTSPCWKTANQNNNMSQGKSYWANDMPSDSPSQAAFYRIMQERDYAQCAAKSLMKELEDVKQEVLTLRERLQQSAAFLQQPLEKSNHSSSSCDKLKAPLNVSKESALRLDSKNPLPTKLSRQAPQRSQSLQRKAALKWFLKGNENNTFGDQNHVLAVNRQASLLTELHRGNKMEVITMPCIDDADSAAGVIKLTASMI